MILKYLIIGGIIYLIYRVSNRPKQIDQTPENWQEQDEIADYEELS